MKQEKRLSRLILRCVAFLLPLLIILVGLSYLFLPKDNLPEFGMEDQRANGILGEPENTIDLVIVGDSETYCTFSPMRMWRDMGFTSYVCGTSAQQMWKSYDYIEKVFQTQQPKIIVMETNALYRNIQIRRALYNEAADYLQVLRYHDRWKSLNSRDFGGAINYTFTTNYKGFYILTDVQDGYKKDYMEESEETREINQKNLFYLNLIQKKCEKEGAELILVSTPSTKNWSSEKHNAVQAYADKKNLPYLDMNLYSDEMELDWTGDSRDGGDHLNLRGAMKATTFFGNWILENYDMPDHREDPAYQSWNDCLEIYRIHAGWPDKSK